MGKLFLTKNRVIDLTDEQSLYLAKCIVSFPPYKEIRVAGATFTIDEIDLEALKKSRLPQQTKLDIRVKTVAKKTRRAME